MNIELRRFSTLGLLAKRRARRTTDGWIEPATDFQASNLVIVKGNSNHWQVDVKELMIGFGSVLILDFDNCDLAAPRIKQ